MFRIDNTESRRILPNYYAILDGRKSALYLRTKNIVVDADLNDTTENLWNIHNLVMSSTKFESIPDKRKVSLLELKYELAKRIYKKCNFCERKCGADRSSNRRGHCRVLESKIASEFIHWGEEPEIIPSYTIFFSGCTFNCVFCQNWDISQFADSGSFVSPETVARWIERRQCRNVNWVGGDPTPNVLFILETLKYCDKNIPIVWNSNMYMSLDTMKILDMIVDLYLTDFKYGNDTCAKRLSNVPNYWSVITRNHKIANEQCEMIIRHLVLPNHVDCCSKPALKWISENLNLDSVRVNVMAQYRPEYKAYKYEDIDRRLRGNEFREAYRYAERLGLSLTD
jgi:putative pyruvate formate lyase activating enzyme